MSQVHRGDPADAMCVGPRRWRGIRARSAWPTPTPRPGSTGRARRTPGRPVTGPTVGGPRWRHCRGGEGIAAPTGRDRRREEREDGFLAPGASRALGAGERARDEEPDEWRTCFERDRDRILHATSFRRLAGKTQVFVFPQDHQRTRLTHALEVAQVATGDGPGLPAQRRPDRSDRPRPRLRARAGRPRQRGRAATRSCPAGSTTRPGARTCRWLRSTSAPRPSTASPITRWSRPAPATPEGEVVSWADRVAYVCHDWEDAVLTGIVSPHQLPLIVRDLCGERRSAQLGAFIHASWSATLRSGQVGHGRGRGRSAGGLPRLQLRAHLPARCLAAPGRGRGARAAGTGRALRRPAPPDRRGGGGGQADIVAGGERPCGPPSPTWPA